MVLTGGMAIKRLANVASNGVAVGLLMCLPLWQKPRPDEGKCTCLMSGKGWQWSLRETASDSL